MMETESGAQLKLLALLALSFNVGPALAAQRIRAPLPHPPEWGRSSLVCWRPPLRVYFTRSPKSLFSAQTKVSLLPHRQLSEGSAWAGALWFLPPFLLLLSSLIRPPFCNSLPLISTWNPHEGSRGRGNTLAACDVGVARRLFEAIWSRHMWEKRR